MNWGGLNTKDLEDLYQEALEFLKADSKRHESHGRHVYAEELKHHLEVVEEKVRRLQNTVNALMPSQSATSTTRPKLGMMVKIGDRVYKSLTDAARDRGVNKHTISRMIRDGEAQKV